MVMGPKISEKLGPDENKLGIPVIAIIGLPLLALLIVLFLGFGFALQRQQADLTRTYSERTAEFLARDLADQLGQLLTPAAEYTDTLAETLERAKCSNADCAFSVIRAQRDVASAIPAQVAYLRFGGTDGQLFSIYKRDQNDSGFLGTVESRKDDSSQLIISEPGKEPRTMPYAYNNTGWYQAGMVRAEPIWSAPYKGRITNICKLGEGDSWNLQRVVRVNDVEGEPLGVLAVNVCLTRASLFLQNMIGKTVEKITIHTRSGENILVGKGQLTIVPNNAPVKSANIDQLVYKEVSLTDPSLKGWRLAVALGPELSQQAIWDWKHTLGLLTGLLSSIALATVAAAYVVDPVKRLSRAVVGVGALELDTPIAVPTRVRELAFLASVIEKMRGVLHGNQTRLEFLAYHNPANGFLNHAGLTRAYVELTTKPGHIDLVLIKIRNYHHIGGIMGDVALARIMARNIAIVEKELEGSVVGCINDSEIACLYASEEGLDSVRLRQVLEWMRAPHDDDGISVSADISASVSSRQNESDRFDTLLRRANGALYHAEETRSEDAVWYNPEVIQDLREALEFRGDIARSIVNGEFFLEFQPIVMLKTGTIEGVQALAVWQHPQLGLIKQNKFFSVFEKNGYIRDVGLFTISRSFEFLHRFNMRHPERKLPVCIILSLVQLIDPLFVERVTELQREWSIKGGDVVFVILKNAGALDDPQILRALGKLRDLGFRLAVDYAVDSAGLSKLSSVRSETLVIRPALQRNIEHAGPERTILRSVCRLAAELEMFSLAVGIERHAVLAPLIDCGCTYGMGPWFGNAASEQEFLDAYAEDAALPAVPGNGLTA